MPLFLRLLSLSLSCAALSGCTTQGPMRGTPEFAAAQVSRGYDCGLRVDRARVMARLPREDRASFLQASSSFAVKSYKAPRRCDTAERGQVQQELAALSRR